jgi:2-dehydropantoate 2-reductase
LEAIRSKGLRFRTPNGSETVVRPSAATDNPSSVGGTVDGVFVCTKGYDLAGACRALVPVVGPQTVILPLLNGADIYERCRSIIQDAVVLPGGIYISSSVAEPGLVVQSGGKGNLFLGPEPGKKSFNYSPFKTLLDRASFPYEWQDDPFPAIWNKYLFIAAYGLVTGWTGKTIGEVIADGELAGTTLAIQREIAAIALRRQINLPPDAAAAAFEKGKSFPPSTKTSFQRDLETPGKPNEGELFGETIIKLGKETGVPTPVTERVYGHIRNAMGKKGA